MSIKSHKLWIPSLLASTLLFGCGDSTQPDPEGGRTPFKKEQYFRVTQIDSINLQIKGEVLNSSCTDAGYALVLDSTNQVAFNYKFENQKLLFQIDECFYARLSGGGPGVNGTWKNETRGDAFIPGNLKEVTGTCQALPSDWEKQPLESETNLELSLNQDTLRIFSQISLCAASLYTDEVLNFLFWDDLDLDSGRIVSRQISCKEIALTNSLNGKKAKMLFDTSIPDMQIRFEHNGTACTSYDKSLNLPRDVDCNKVNQLQAQTKDMETCIVGTGFIEP